MKTLLRKWIAWYLVMAMFVIGITPKVYAGFSPSQLIGLSPVERSMDVQKIQKFLEMRMVQERFKEFGFTSDEIQARLTQLSDQQVHQLALNLDDLKVGGELGIVIALLVIAILVVILIMITGHRVIVR